MNHSDVIKYPGGGGVIIHRQRRVARCAYCDSPHGFLCDYELEVQGRTCDRKLCSVCASKFGDKDYCPEHAKLVRETR